MKWLLASLADFFWLGLLAQSLSDLGCFVAYPPWPKEALTFGPCECSAGCQRVSETGETAQGMFLSIKAQGEMVAGWPGGFLGSHFWRNPSQI